MYICNVCGKTTEILTAHEERHGFDYPPYEKMVDCCSCGGDFVEAGQCEVCDKWFDKDDGDLYVSICVSCAREYFTPERAMKYIKDANAEKDFYIDYYFNSNTRIASDELITLCKNCFVTDLEYDLHKQEATELIKDFVFGDIYDWCDWVEDELGANK